MNLSFMPCCLYALHVLIFPCCTDLMHMCAGLLLLCYS